MLEVEVVVGDACEFVEVALVVDGVDTCVVDEVDVVPEAGLSAANIDRLSDSSFDM